MKKFNYGIGCNLNKINDKFTQYLFIRCEFWQIHYWITSSSYILYVCKISRKLKITSYVINKFFKLQVFVI